MATVNVLENLRQFALRGDLEGVERIVVVDEGGEEARRKSLALLNGFNVEFHGPREREDFFKTRFGGSYERHLSLVPERAHAETSYGFLVAYEGGADVIIELDDDVYPEDGHSLVKDHVGSLENSGGRSVNSAGRWVNTLDFLILSPSIDLFPRGHPYDPATRARGYSFEDFEGPCVLNMGLWTEIPDLDAVTILYLGGLDGRPPVRTTGIRGRRISPARGSYYAVCSMNTAFRREIVPAFYQLYMRFMGIDRYDDIWSGIFVKRIADALGDRLCLGAPAAKHLKRPRSVWKDIRAELEGMVINEILWRIVDSSEISSRSYADAYLELADHLDKSLDMFREEAHAKFMRAQIERMRIWVETVDRLG